MIKINKITIDRKKWLLASMVAACALQSKGEPVMTSPGGQAKSHTESLLEKMVYPDLEERYKKYTEANNKNILLQVVEEMIKKCPIDQPNRLASLMIEAGDLQFEQGNLTKAEEYYNEFSLIFQGHEKAEYAAYKTILCSFKRTLDVDRDQTKTEQTIEMADKFLARSTFTKHAKEVKNIRNDCYRKLTEYEIYVCEFYLKKGSLRASERRLDVIKTEWLPKVPEFAPRIALLETGVHDLRQAKGISVPTLSTVAMEVAQLPKEETTQVAAKKNKHMADRF